MKKLFALISLLGLVAGMGGALNAQGKLDSIRIDGNFLERGVEQNIKFTFSATPGEKFIINWLDHIDTIVIQTPGKQIANHTFPGSYTQSYSWFTIRFYALNPTGHITNLSIDSTNQYNELYFFNCPMLDTLKINYNTLKKIKILNCPALNYLDCSYTKLTVLSIYELPALTYINCNNNPQLTRLGLGELPVLQTLDFSNTQVDVLRLSDFPELKTLTFSSVLRILTLSDLPSLRSLDCSHTPLEDLSLSKLPALQSLDCSHTPLEEFSLSKLPALKSLDFSHTQITYLQLLDSFPSLQILNVSNTPLTGLIIEILPALQSLDCSNTQLSEYVGLENCPVLQSVNCSNTQCQSIGITHHSQLTTLNLADNPMLGSVFCENNQLRTLNIDNCINLKSLCCDHNQLTTLDISSCTSLEELDIRNNQFSSFDLSPFVLRSFRCDSNHIPLSTVTNLAKHLFAFSMTPQLLTAGIIQVGDTLDLRGECQIDYYNTTEKTQCSVFLNEKEVNDQFYTTGQEQEPDYGLFAFHRPGSYRIVLSGNNITNIDNTKMFPHFVYYDLTVVDSVARPLFSIPSGAIWPDTVLVLSTPTPNARIYYTTDGREPDENALLYQEPIRLSEAMTVKAIAIQDTFKSRIAASTYVIDTVARPTFSISSGAVVWPDTTLILGTATPDACIHYTIDGSEPDENALLYQDPIHINEAMTVKAIAIRDTFTSCIATATYTIDTVARPTFSIPSGAVRRDTVLMLSTSIPDANVYYTTDGNEPDETAILYKEPFRITEAVTIKAVAIYKTVQSQVTTATYTIDSVANEHDLRGSKLRVYAKDQTIYLSEAVGEVEVFTMDGHCVYRGYDVVISVGKSGLYIVSATGRRWKVAVR